MDFEIQRTTGIRTGQRLLALGLLAVCTGCAELGDDRLTPVWGISPLLLFAVGGGLAVYSRRRRQLQSWDLKESPRAPSPGPIVAWLWGLAGALFAAFSIYNFLLEMDGEQKLYNVGLWLFGSLVGLLLALLVGPRFANRSALPGPAKLPELPEGKV